MGTNKDFVGASYLDNGEAWVAFRGKEIAYTKDYGVTWSLLPSPGLGDLFDNICFNNKREGIIGTQFGELNFTPDNCKTWDSLPTPLTQGKYRKLSLDNPSIKRAAIFKDYLLVSQENLVFYTKKNKVNWKHLPGYTDFYTDPAGSALFFELSNHRFVKSDKHFKPIAPFETVEANFSDPVCRNGSLFFLAEARTTRLVEDKIAQLNADNQLIVSRLCPKTVAPKPSPHYLESTGSRTFGAVGNKIYTKERWDEDFQYAFTLPFAIDSGYLSAEDYGTIVFNRNDDSVFYYKIADGTVKGNDRKKMLDNFCSKGIKTIIFSSSEDRGHHHVYFSDNFVYDLQKDRFTLTRKVHTGQDFISLKNEPAEIDKKIVDEFVKTLPAIYKKQATIDDLGFTREEYDSCRKNILAFKAYIDSAPVYKLYDYQMMEQRNAFCYPENNLDFNKLITVVDSVKTIKPDFITNYFHYVAPSKNSHGLLVVLINENNEELRIKPAKASNYAPFCFPWYISINGAHMENRAIEINRFMKAVYPGFLPPTSKMFILQYFVKQLYAIKYL